MTQIRHSEVLAYRIIVRKEFSRKGLVDDRYVWRTGHIALVDGTLLSGFTEANLGVPAYVLSGSERDGRQLARRLDDGRGWLRKDATGQERFRGVDAMSPVPSLPG